MWWGADSEFPGAPLPELRTQLHADLGGVNGAGASGVVAQEPGGVGPGAASADEGEPDSGPVDDVGDEPADSGGFAPAAALPGWRGATAAAAAPRSAGPPPQPPFQPGACPADEHYLMQYNVVGRVVRKPLEDQFVVDTIYHDNARHRKRMPPIRPSHDFALAALSDAGAAACRCRLLNRTRSVPAANQHRWKAATHAGTTWPLLDGRAARSWMVHAHVPSVATNTGLCCHQVGHGCHSLAARPGLLAGCLLTLADKPAVLLICLPGQSAQD